MTGRGCCIPARPVGQLAASDPSSADSPVVATPRLHTRLTPIAAADFSMGSDDPGAYAEDGETPVRGVHVGAFRIDSRCVSNADFDDFVDATGYRTDAERVGSSFVFSGLLPDDAPPTRGVVGAEWWRELPGADWRHPEGPWSFADDRGDHPVVHVSWNDAVAYCNWAGTRLPTEPEWEYAARGGIEGCRFPWGNKLLPDGEHRMNVWQGRFPTTNTLADGFLGPAPVASFPPNGYGLHNMTGNVWEWTSDTWATAPARPDGPIVVPGGVPAGERKVLKGGSYLCHASYCFRYRVSARMGNTPDSSTGNIGFRCAAHAAGPADEAAASTRKGSR